MSDDTLFESNLRSFPLLHRGKVRDNYAIGDDRLLIVASDRLSAFDVVMPDPIPGKGRVLTSISNFWFARTRHIVANHLTGEPLAQFLPDAAERATLEGRAVVVRRLQPLPVEAVVRGYLIGSGWKDYQATGAVCGIALPPGLRQAAKLPAPIFTPATKAAAGQHDENVAYAEIEETIGRERASRVRELAISLYNYAAEHARGRGILIGRWGRAHGRGADAGFLAFLAGRRIPRGREPAVIRQAIRARLPRDARLEQAGAGAAAA